VAQTPKTNKPGSPAPASSEAPDLARKFMRENPAGSLPDPPEFVEGRSNPVPVAEGGETPQTLFDRATPEGDQPAVETPVADAVATPETREQESAATAPGEAATSPTPEAEVPTKPEAPAAQPVAQVKPAEPAAAPAPVVAEVPKLDLAAKYTMADGSEWTGQQVTDALYQRAEILPKAAEADRFRATFGASAEEAEARWKPFLERVAAAPEAQREYAEHILSNADPALLDYLQRSEQYFYSPEGGGFQRPAAPAEKPAAAKPSDALPPRLERIANQMERQLINTRVTNERAELFSRYPFMAHNQKAYQALTTIASQYFAADEAAGKSPLECRGLLDAMRDQQVFLDSMSIAAAQATRPAVESKPGVGAQALLPGNGPASNGGTARPAPRREYSGPKEGAKAAFLQDFPE
jgi:hypothetical protein